MSQKEDKGRPADSGLQVDCCRRSEGLGGDCGGGKRMESEIERLGRYSPCQWGGFYLWNSDWVLLWQLNLETSKRYSAEEDLPKCRKDQLRVWSSAVSEGIRNVKSIRPRTRRGMPKTITSIKSSFSYYSLLRFYLTEGWSKPKQRMEMKKTNIMLTETHLLFRLARQGGCGGVWVFEAVVWFANGAVLIAVSQFQLFVYLLVRYTDCGRTITWNDSWVLLSFTAFAILPNNKPLAIPTLYTWHSYAHNPIL